MFVPSRQLNDRLAFAEQCLDAGRKSDGEDAMDAAENLGVPLEHAAATARETDGMDNDDELFDAALTVVCTIFGDPRATDWEDHTWGLTETEQLEAIRQSAAELKTLVDSRLPNRLACTMEGSDDDD